MTDMEKMRNAAASVLHALVIAAILFLIFFGLYRIGLLTLPEPLEKLFGRYTPEQTAPADTLSEDSADGNAASLEKVVLTEETVRELLNGLTPPVRYAAEVKCTLYEGDKSRTTQFAVLHDGTYDTAYCLDNANVIKQVLCDGKTVCVGRLEGNTCRTVSYAAGDITFEEQLGAVVTHRSFLGKIADEAYTYEMYAENGRVSMLITCRTSAGGYAERQEYTMDLDTGLVTQTVCYQNDVCVYTTEMTSFREDLILSADISAPYLEQAQTFFSTGEENP